MTLPSITLRDVAVVLALAGTMAAEALWFPYEDGELTWLTWVRVAGIALPALVCRTYPALALTISVVMIYPLTDPCPVVNTAPFAAMVAGYWLAHNRGRRVALTAGALLVPWVLFLLSQGGMEKVLSFETPKNLAFVALPIVLGLAARYRERSMQALRDRAEQAERSREQEALRRVDEERLRIARGVHDVVSHSMVAINVQAGVGAHLIDNDPTAARDMLLDIRRVSAETLTDLRGILGLLRESGGRTPVEPTVTLDSLESLASMLRAAGVDVDLHVDLHSDQEGDPLPASVDATAYRVVQEALTNVLRHAPGSRARVRVERTPDDLSIEVADRGSDGPTEVPGGTGSGLYGMAERVHAVGGEFHAGPQAEGGWLVAARLPLRSPSGPVVALPKEEWA